MTTARNMLSENETDYVLAYMFHDHWSHDDAHDASSS